MYKCACSDTCRAYLSVTESAMVDGAVSIFAVGDDGSIQFSFLTPADALKMALELAEIANHMGVETEQLQNLADSIDALLVAKLTNK